MEDLLSVGSWVMDTEPFLAEEIMKYLWRYGTGSEDAELRKSIINRGNFSLCSTKIVIFEEDITDLAYSGIPKIAWAPMVKFLLWIRQHESCIYYFYESTIYLTTKATTRPAWDRGMSLMCNSRALVSSV